MAQNKIIMQKIVNIVAVTSGIVSLAVVVGGLSLYVQRDQLIDNVKQQAIDAVLGGSGGLGGALAPDVGVPQMAPPASAPAETPQGLGIPN